MAVSTKQITAADISAGGDAIKTDIIYGYVNAIHVHFEGAATTVDIDEDGEPGRKLVDLASGNTDTTVYLKVQATDNTGSAITGQYVPVMLAGRATVTVTTPVTVYVFYEAL